MSTHDHGVRQRPGGSVPEVRGPRPTGERPPSFWTSKTGLAAIGFLLIAAFLLLSEHRAHALGFLPYLLILACPLLHLLHGGHGGRGGHGGHSGANPPRRGEDEP